MNAMLPKLLIALGIGLMLAFGIGTAMQMQQPSYDVANFTSPTFTPQAIDSEPRAGEKLVAAGVKDGVIAEPIVSEHVQLPNAEGLPWLTFVYPQNWKSDPETIRLHSMWERDPRLKDLRSRCRVNTFEKMTEAEKLGWMKYTGNNTPTIVLQLAGGQVVSKISRSNIPANSDQLYAQIKYDCDRCKPKPSPGPVQPVQPVQPLSPIPDTVQPPIGPDAPTDGDPLWILALLGAGGTAVGVALGRKHKRRMK